MRRSVLITGAALIAFATMGDDCSGQSSVDQKEQQQQTQITGEALAQTGMPNIVNFRERKLLKDIYELRDQTGLVTYTYLYNEMTGKLVPFCDSIGYGIPYATEYTNPVKAVGNVYHALTSIGQADPNGLYSPSSAEGTWVMCQDPAGKQGVKPVYVEPRVIVTPFRLAQ